MFVIVSCLQNEIQQQEETSEWIKIQMTFGGSVHRSATSTRWTENY
ncbi:hypothetical protein N184_07915 [Sinorhizobium sp. GL28]|nr:hypothetical protein N183_06120 [Sinorhizobium sp. Sb3]KSV88828.1 hypothetical protein N184_07915 [Sinorhizobium sp. GL28]